jgi:hypothetical protein
MFPDIRAELHRAPSLDEIRATEQARNRSAP